MGSKDFNELVDELRSIADSLEESVHAKFVNINTTLDSLQSKVAGAIEQAEEAYDAAESVEDRLDDHAEEISELNDSFDSMENKVNTLESDVSDIILIEGE